MLSNGSTYQARLWTWSSLSESIELERARLRRVAFRELVSMFMLLALELDEIVTFIESDCIALSTCFGGFVDKIAPRIQFLALT